MIALNLQRTWGDRVIPFPVERVAAETAAAGVAHARIPAALLGECDARVKASDWTSTTKSLLVALIDRIPLGGAWRVSQAGLADCVGVSRRTVQRHTLLLERDGYVRIDRERVSRDRMAMHSYALCERVVEMLRGVCVTHPVRQIGAGNNIYVVSTDDSVHTTNLFSAKTAHDPVEALIEEGFDRERVEATIKYAERRVNIENPAGFARSALRGGWNLPGVDELLREAARKKPGYYSAGLAIDDDEPMEDDEVKIFRRGNPVDDAPAVEPGPEPVALWVVFGQQMTLQWGAQQADLLRGMALESEAGGLFVIRIPAARQAVCVRHERGVRRLLADVWGYRFGEVRIVWEVV